MIYLILNREKLRRRKILIKLTLINRREERRRENELKNSTEYSSRIWMENKSIINNHKMDWLEIKRKKERENNSNKLSNKNWSNRKKKSKNN